MTDKATTPPLTGAELDRLEALARAAEVNGWDFHGPSFAKIASPSLILGLIAQARAQQAGAAPADLVRAGWFIYEGIEWVATSSDDPRATILYRKVAPEAAHAQQDAAPAVQNPYFDYLREYWQLGFDGKPMTACTGDKPLKAYNRGKADRAAVAPSDAKRKADERALFEIADLLAQLASAQQAKEYEQRHAVESEKALAQVQAQLARQSQGEPVHQVKSKLFPHAWHDIGANLMEPNERDGFETRTLYAAPPLSSKQQAAPVCRNCLDFGWEPTVSGPRRPCSFCHTDAGEQQAEKGESNVG